MRIWNFFSQSILATHSYFFSPCSLLTHWLTPDILVPTAHILCLRVRIASQNVCRVNDCIMDLDTGFGINLCVMRSCGFLMNKSWTSGHQPRPLINILMWFCKAFPASHLLFHESCLKTDSHYIQQPSEKWNRKVKRVWIEILLLIIYMILAKLQNNCELRFSQV